MGVSPLHRSLVHVPPPLKVDDLFCIIYLHIFLVEKKKREKRENRERVGVWFYLLSFNIIYYYFNLGPTSQESHCNGYNRYQ